MKAKGAVRNKVKKNRIIDASWMNYLKPVSIVITLTCVVLSVTLLLAQLINKDVNQLQIEATFAHVSEEDIRTQLQGVFPDGFVYLDVSKVNERLIELPMISSVQVEKIWPDTLKVSVQEEKPVATWNGSSMVSQQGEILPLALAQLQLPQLQGSEGESRMVMQHFQLFNRWGKRHQLNLISLNSTASGWQLTYKNSLQIWLDNAQAMHGLQQLESVLQQFQLERIQRIDMRYEQGFAVAWKDQAQVQGKEKII